MAEPYFEDDRVSLHHGDCLDVLAELPDASVDAVVTDPPYGLANTDPAHVAETITRWVNGERDYLPGGAGFMGKAWDAFVPPVAVWDDCLRVLKPGGHVLAFAGSRTVDLMTLGLRLAGFDIRDSIAWLYGSGFPKSLDVSKAIDKRRDWSLVEALSGEIKRARTESGMSLAEIGQATLSATDGAYGKWYHRGGHMFFETGRSLPSRPEWEHLRHVLPIAPEFAEVYDEAEREVTGQHVAGNPIGVYEFKHGEGKGRTANERRDVPATDAARTWQGWGTALKPAFEPVVVARKPLAGTVATNVLAHGTGALNIDGCRVDAGARPLIERAEKPTNRTTWNSAEDGAGTTTQGRWPANVVLDESQAAALDEQSGELTSGANPTRRGSDKFRDAYGDFAGQEECVAHRGADTGGASRFFATFVGCDVCGEDMEGWHRDARGEHVMAHVRLHIPDEMADKPLAPAPFLYTPKADATERVRVNGTAHPTVKPLALMRWLVRLVTPPGGTVLEPFAGSGTTVEACILEGFRCIAIEREADYLPLIRQRINRRRDPVEAIKGAGEDGGLFDLLDGGAA